jgi:rhodanese-related sulfurtransferase
VSIYLFFIPKNKLLYCLKKNNDYITRLNKTKFKKMSIQVIDSLNAYDMLRNDKNSLLIDVRTTEEFNLVGIVDSSNFNNRMILLPWQYYQDGEMNQDFLSTLNTNLNNFFKENLNDINLIFICRSGSRSFNASNYIANNGYKNCFNISDGFEGAIDKNHQRSKINGWKYNNLPWKQ